MNIEIKGIIFRRDGQWRIRLNTDSWVIKDILRDAENQQGTVITIAEYDSRVYGRGNDLLANVLFEEVVTKKDEPQE